ncbi:hypothetical protein J4466_05290 [Candidatus Pacearchaeota archaeon]|nr:hypothetical protein [Candidatus Pacearchaeota archaeon]
MKKRVCFSEGNQKRFLLYSKNKLDASWNELSEKLKVNFNTLSKSYLFEVCQMPYGLFDRLTELLKEDREELLKRYNGRIVEEKFVIGRKVFGEQRNVFNEINILYEKIDLILDNSKISFSRIDKEKRVNLPDKITPALAEEIGMHYGDGFLSDKRYTYRLKGNAKDEVEYYNNYIKPLFKQLYNVEVNLKKFDTTFGFELHSQAICEFKIKTLGIKPGKKYEIEFPDCLRVNNSEVLASFIRGLFDTDGNLSFQTKYGYKDYYPVISISLASKRIIKEVGEILKMLGFKPWIGFDEQYGRISLYGIGTFKRYKDLIGWNSPKNLSKITKWEERYPRFAD